ncbi:MAG: zf-HC2 domain-containing protein [Gemmatimonadetes bacterium]|nr:zf-HC2 domain-containing protein [Gemmatimonadota bacterium]
MTETLEAPHHDDAELLRWLDGALPPDEQAAVTAHLALCADCASRRGAIARRVSRLSALLEAADWPVPKASPAWSPTFRAGRGWGPWAVAAALTLFLGSMAVPGVRAWIAGAARALWETTLGRPAIQETAPGVGASGSTVTFVPSGPILTIRVPTPRGGRLLIEVVDGDRVAAAGGDAEWLVLPAELQIRNATDPLQEYHIRVPSRLNRVDVVVGDAAPRGYRPNAPGERWTVSLQPAVSR